MEIPSCEYDDLKAFERRMGEIVRNQRPSPQCWLLIGAGAVACGILCAFYLLGNPDQESALPMKIICSPVVLFLALSLEISCCLKCLFLNKKYFLKQLRPVLKEYCLDYSEDGKLLLLNYSK